MTLKDFGLTERNHFVAMEYYALILNRTYLVLIDSEFLIGIKVNGPVAVEGASGTLAGYITRRMAIQGDLHNPNSYIKPAVLESVKNIDLLSTEFLNQKGSFRFPLSEIENVHHDASKKWGMGNYPHDGKIYILVGGKRREFIILGQQSGEMICNQIKQKIAAYVTRTQ